MSIIHFSPQFCSLLTPPKVLEYTGLLASERGRYLGQMQGCIESTPPSADTTTLRYWEKSIIEPLIQSIGLEGFRPIVNNVQTLIVNGVFRNLREVELKLIYDAKVSQPMLTPCNFH